ncbi:hypothetical protein [Neptuniibacter sp. QD37_11]|uniref:hypothetical protein n=1 Tax=Neptuniibacter sp. QD37_11 TaxID=3398209 RepID=UPI0039F4D8C3
MSKQNVTDNDLRVAVFESSRLRTHALDMHHSDVVSVLRELLTFITRNIQGSSVPTRILVSDIEQHGVKESALIGAIEKVCNVSFQQGRSIEGGLWVDIAVFGGFAPLVSEWDVTQLSKKEAL